MSPNPGVEERIWCVWTYPDQQLAYTGASYEDCDAWRRANDLCTVIIPKFFS